MSFAPHLVELLNPGRILWAHSLAKEVHDRSVGADPRILDIRVMWS